MNKRALARFVRFCLVGCINSIFGYSMIALFLYIGAHYSLAVFLGMTCGVLFNFKTTGALVFKNRDNRLIIKFIAAYVVSYATFVAGLWGLKQFGMSDYIASAALVFPVAIVTYCLQSIFVFKIPMHR